MDASGLLQGTFNILKCRRLASSDICSEPAVGQTKSKSLNQTNHTHPVKYWQISDFCVQGVRRAVILYSSVKNGHSSSKWDTQSSFNWTICSSYTQETATHMSGFVGQFCPL